VDTKKQYQTQACFFR